MKKTVFHKFCPDIYPTNIYVAVTNSQTDICDMFLDEHGQEIGDLPIHCDALCMSVAERSNNERVDLIVFRKKEYMTVSTMAHESFHCAENICRKLGIVYNNEDNNEAFAYLIGYIIDCCDQVRTNKLRIKS